MPMLLIELDEALLERASSPASPTVWPKAPPRNPVHNELFTDSTDSILKPRVDMGGPGEVRVVSVLDDGKPEACSLTESLDPPVDEDEALLQAGYLPVMRPCARIDSES